MSILNVEHLTHGFGDRAIFNDVSFRLLKGEHIGLVGANGEGKSTFMNIVTGKLMPDEGKVEWAKNVRVGYLDQHSTLTKGMTIESVLKSAFAWLFELEENMNQICDRLGEAEPDEMDAMMEELGVIQDTLTMHDFYIIDAKVEEVARALGLLDPGLILNVQSILSRLKQGKTTEDIPAILQGIFRPSVQPYLISWMQYDPREVIRQVKQPVLIVNGDNDIQISADNAEALAQARPDADKVIIEGMTHLLKQSEVTDPQRQKTTIYMDAAAPVSEKLVSVMADFIRRI